VTEPLWSISVTLHDPFSEAFTCRQTTHFEREIRREGVGHPGGPATRRACRRPSGTGCEDLPVPVPLVIDTDPGIDDALAILLALASPEVDLRLVTSVHGNVELAQTTENALRVLHLAGRSDVPVAAGAAESLIHPRPERAGHVHGDAGLGGVQLPPSPAPVDPRPAVVALAELLMGSPDPVTVAAIGPWTNIALLLRVFPEAAARIGRLVLMGGSAGRGGNVTAAAEFNVWADPEAASVVLTAGLPTVMVGLDVTVPTVLPAEGIARFAAAGPIGAQAAAILRHYLDNARAFYGTDGVVVHDALALTEAIAPGTLGAVRRDVVVDTGLGVGRGQTLVDRRRVSASATAVDVAEQVDSPAAIEFLVSRVAGLDRPT
jgi:pyrimidine-specific ribonucleoside hydrolase